MMIHELETIWKEVVMAYCMVLPQYLPGWTMENKKPAMVASLHDNIGNQELKNIQQEC
jgi:hypothetical protein